MGESIAEGTIVRSIKKVGDSVDRDEPLFEISTDKVDAEIPSPVAGVLLEITAREGETVPVNTPVATIGAPGSQPRPAPTAPAAGTEVSRRRRGRSSSSPPRATWSRSTRRIRRGSARRGSRSGCWGSSRG